MNAFFEQIFNLLTTSPGNLVYHLILAFSVAAALQAVVISQRQNTPNHPDGRMAIGLGIVLFSQLLLFVVSGLSWQGMVSPHRTLTPLDRTITAICLLWFVWLWALPKSSRFADLAVSLLSLVVVIFFGLTLASWQSFDPAVGFNTTWLDFAWTIASAFIALVGILLLLLKRPPAWEIGLLFFGLNLTGILIHLLIPPTNGDFAGAIRLMQVCSYPLLPSLILRVSAPETSASVVDATLTGTPVVERRRYRADPRAVHAWLALANQPDPSMSINLLAQSVAQTMVSDLCYIIMLSPGQKDILLQGGYDLIREEVLPGGALPASQVTIIANALQRGRPLRLLSGTAPSTDLVNLAKAIGLKEPGSLLMIPLNTNQGIIGAILLLSPYSNRQWTSEDQSYLISCSNAMAAVLQRGRDGSSQFLEIDRLSNLLQNAQNELNQLRSEYTILLNEVTALRSAASSAHTDSEMQSLMAVHQETQESLVRMQQENIRLQAALQVASAVPASTQEIEHMESELRRALQENARLQNSLADASMKLMSLQQRYNQAGVPSTEEREVLAAIVQELRQPMSSIIGYTDLLLGESVGILGSLQRKFLDRIKASSERMRSLLDDLLQITAIQSAPVEILPQSIELGGVIDYAIAETSPQIRDKNIALKVDIPEELPQINADRDALQQIVIQLLKNATAATPREGEMVIKVQLREEENRQMYMLLQVTDSGGGIPSEDLPRVFNRRYRAESTVIQGVGDTGVGLSIAKALVEAHHGRIWVESEPGKTSTFSILLPIDPQKVTASLP